MTSAFDPKLKGDIFLPYPNKGPIASWQTKRMRAASDAGYIRTMDLPKASRARGVEPILSSVTIFSYLETEGFFPNTEP